MSKERVLNLVLGSALLVSILSVSYLKGQLSFVNTTGTENKDIEMVPSNEMLPREAVLNVIRNRKSVRKFIADKKISREDWQEMIKAGMAAPTATNAQPWCFAVVEDKELLKRLASASTYGKMIANGSGAIVVYGDLKKAFKPIPEFWIQDTSAATENILLAIEAMGYGAVWTAVYPKKELEEQVREILKTPNHLIPLCILAVGYPTGVEKPKNKWKDENFFWNEWER